MCNATPSAADRQQPWPGISSMPHHTGPALSMGLSSAAECVLGAVVQVQKSVIASVRLVDLRHQSTRLRSGASNEQVDRLIRRDWSSTRLIEVLVNDVLELPAEHRAWNQELLLVDF